MWVKQPVNSMRKTRTIRSVLNKTKSSVGARNSVGVKHSLGTVRAELTI